VFFATGRRQIEHNYELATSGRSAGRDLRGWRCRTNQVVVPGGGPEAEGSAMLKRRRIDGALNSLWAAAYFSRGVGRFEQNSQDKFAGEILALSSACIFSSWASLEAYANELIADREKTFSGYQPALLDRLWDALERESTLDKFDLILLFRRAQPFQKNARPYQDVAALRELRNALIHFDPEWEDESKKYKCVSDKLRYKFTPGPFEPKDALIFPNSWATHQCTKWAVESCHQFMREFESRARMDPKVPIDFSSTSTRI
jgi:hypothetical protein